MFDAREQSRLVQSFEKGVKKKEQRKAADAAFPATTIFNPQSFLADGL